ncbi:unnamed protein product [Closterium sp. NIES-64]|nr:unnamed protein product [Closterium sp. NIES-64]
MSGLPRSLPPLPASPAPPCLPCVEGRQRAAPHFSLFPPTEAPLQTFHQDVWGPARVRGQGGERYFLLVVDDYSRYTTVFPLCTKEEVGDASRFRDRGPRALLRDTSADKIFRTIPCVFLGFVPDAPGSQFYHPTSHRVFPSRDVTFDESVPFYRLFPYRTAPLPPAAFPRSRSPPIDPVPLRVLLLSLGVLSLRLAESRGAAPICEVLRDTHESGLRCVPARGVELLELLVMEALGALVSLVLELLVLEVLELPGLVLLLELEVSALWVLLLELGTFRLDVPVPGVLLLVALEMGVLEMLEALELEVLLLESLELEVLLLEALELEVLELVEALELEVLLLESLELEVLELLEALKLEVAAAGVTGAGGAAAGGAGAGGCGAVGGARATGSWWHCTDPEYDLVRAAHRIVTRLLATVVTDPSFESAAASALVSELVDFAASCRLDYAASPVAESKPVCPPSVSGECALGMDVLEDRQEDSECLAAAAPHLVAMLLAPEGDPDAPDILTPAIAGPYSSHWQAAMDAEMASWKSTGTYVDEVPPSEASIVDDMRISG